MPPSVTVSIVNYNHLRHLPECLRAIRAQTLKPAILVTDNASIDGSAAWLQEHGDDLELILNHENRGFAAAHNEAFQRSTSDFVLALNCDVVLAPDFLEALASAMTGAPQAGSACGTLYLGSPGASDRLDSTGLFPDRFRRFHDRDHGRPASGFSRPAGPIFGPSGSAALYRRSMLEDVAPDGEYFDEDFFAYYEDADLAWRSRRLGWESIYVPEARGWHVHDDLSRARSGRRDAGATFRQLLLIRNRHLCLLKNDSSREALRDLPWIGGYDLALEVYLLLRKPGLAFRWPREVMRLLPPMQRKRANLLERSPAAVRLSDWRLP